MGKRAGVCRPSSNAAAAFDGAVATSRSPLRRVTAARHRRKTRNSVLEIRLVDLRVYGPCQSSSPSPPTRINSRALCVTILSPRRNAQAASNRS